MSPKQSPYAYMIEHALALGILKPAELRAIGLHPADFSPDLSQIKPDSYRGKMLPSPQKPPYPPNDPIIAALAKGFDKNLIRYRQIDLIGIHPAHLPGASAVIARRKKSVWKHR